MTRATLALGGAIVIAAIIGLYVALRTGEPAQPAASTAAPASPTPPPAVPRSDDAADGKLRIRRAPSSATTEAENTTASAPQIRDHRAPTPTERPAAAPPAVAPPPPIRAETGRQITAALAQQIQPALRQCTAGVAADARGKHPRFEGQLFVAITAGQATINGASFELLDVNDAAQPDDIKQCLTKQVIGLAAPAAGEPDVERYAINLSLSWP